MGEEFQEESNSTIVESQVSPRIREYPTSDKVKEIQRRESLKRQESNFQGKYDITRAMNFDEAMDFANDGLSLEEI